jgi:hypothetical protein
LLSPGLGERAAVDSVEAGIFDERHNGLLRRQIVARYGKSDSSTRPWGKPFVGQGDGEDVVPSLDHRMTDLFGDPKALDLPVVDGRDQSVAKGKVI